jgi:hypothetical protein
MSKVNREIVLLIVLGLGLEQSRQECRSYTLNPEP